ncbi:MAG: ATP-binding protein [Candidatus Nomurabacteria bacterium]|jgi:predicted AAA+ superfamily ATPase|nr:ATP-binding protein [Candidatus Nomurabacteria bacterium]
MDLQKNKFNDNIVVMISRELVEQVKTELVWYPIVSLTGPRQSGKSTLLRTFFSEFDYVTLEDVDALREVTDDPRGFLNRRKTPLIIDEAQKAPELFSYIQTKTDNDNTVGEYILSGSQNFLMMKRITQSLAGRVGILRLMPLSYRELSMTTDEIIDLNITMLRGGYPRLYDRNINPEVFFHDYLETYVERDVRDLSNVHDLNKFRSFIQLCALRNGQLINYASLASDVGVSEMTIRGWLSLLETSYIIRVLPPYYRQLSRRLIKSPKFYFIDTGFLCYLLDIKTVDELKSSKYYGSIFEAFVISEIVKNSYNQGKSIRNICFYRDSESKEIDLVIENRPDDLELYEIKASETRKSDFADAVNSIGELLSVSENQRNIIYQGEDGVRVSGVNFINWRKVVK